VKTQQCLPLGAAAAPRRPPPQPQRPAASAGAAACTTCLALVPGPGQQLLVGTTTGAVLRGARAGAPPPPRVFTPQEGRLTLGQLALNAAGCGSGVGSNIEAAPGGRCSGGDQAVGLIGAAVLGLAACPSRPEAFLAGRADGSLSLHVLSRSAAVRVWEGAAAAPLIAVGCVGGAVVGTGRQPGVAWTGMQKGGSQRLASCRSAGFTACWRASVANGILLPRRVRWAPRRACVALALDASGCLHCWDFSRDAKRPTASLQLPPLGSGPPCAFALCPCASPSGAAFVVAGRGGRARWHELPAWVGQPQPGDAAALNTLLA
jgi:hypothetical protein